MPSAVSSNVALAAYHSARVRVAGQQEPGQGLFPEWIPPESENGGADN